VLGRLGPSTDDHVEKPNQKWRARVSTLVNDLPDRNRLDTEFFDEFTGHRLGLRLSLVDLSPRKLPQASVTFMVGPPPQQYPVLFPDDRRDH
tara:strand:+ start:2565 stop:2840 length:276 start_codon:yes stop_codon:yes gene_type:complete